MRNYNLARYFALFLALALAGPLAWAQEEDAAKGEPDETVQQDPRQFVDFKPPAGFEPAASDDTAILKWRKGSGEIYLVMGGVIPESRQKLFDQLKEFAGKDPTIAEVRDLKIDSSHAFVYTEKPPEDPGRLRSMRMVVITDKQVLTVDFTAPAKDFESFVGDFDSAIKSFKLKAS